MTRISSRLLTIPPFLALFIVLGGLLLIEPIAYVGSQYFEPDANPPTTRIYMGLTMGGGLVLLFGYPLMVATHLRKMFGRNSRVDMKLLFIISLLVLTIMLIMLIVGRQVMSKMPSEELIGPIMTVSVLGGTLYIYWVTARALVCAEEGPRAPLSHIAITFVMFLFLPIAVFFLQRRLRELIRQGNAPKSS